MHPLVTVICLCYNHARYVAEAVESVMTQSYEDIQLIIVDDASQDSSVEEINKLLEKYPSIEFINNPQNIGMCASFNKALAHAGGDYIIDLAADDVLLPDRVRKQVEAFETLPLTCGVVFSDAWIIREDGKKLRTFYMRNTLGQIIEDVPQGFVFGELVKSYRICSPTIMVRRSVLTELGGYDESLSYEDYDFFVRSSRSYKYHYLDEPLMLKRQVKGSDSGAWYRRKENPHLASTLIICAKALWLCRNRDEKQQLLFSVRYHMRQSFFTENYSLVSGYYELVKSITAPSVSDKLIRYLSLRKISVYRFFSWYLNLRK